MRKKKEANMQVERAEVTLKYAMEVEIPRSTALMGVLDPLLERIVYQDIPTNLSAVKRRIEQLYPGTVPFKCPPCQHQKCFTFFNLLCSLKLGNYFDAMLYIPQA